MNCDLSIGIIGFGRFGRLLHTILTERLENAKFLIYSEQESGSNVGFSSLAETANSDIVIPCVPIAAFEACILELAPLLKADALVIDVCSVKVHPKKCMLNLLPKGVSCIATHPMFGPGTYKKRETDSPSNPLKGLTVVIDIIRSTSEQSAKLRSFFKLCELNMVYMDSDEHDKLTAKFQFICLTAAFILKKLDIERSQIETQSASLMLDYIEMIEVDRQLVRDLHEFNPYCANELTRFENAFEDFVSYIS